MRLKALDNFDIITKVLLYILFAIMLGVTIYAYYDMVTTVLGERVIIINQSERTK